MTFAPKRLFHKFPKRFVTRDPRSLSLRSIVNVVFQFFSRKEGEDEGALPLGISF